MHLQHMIIIIECINGKKNSGIRLLSETDSNNYKFIRLRIRGTNKDLDFNFLKFSLTKWKDFKNVNKVFGKGYVIPEFGIIT